MSSFATWRQELEAFHRSLGLLTRPLNEQHLAWYQAHYAPDGDNRWLEQSWLNASDAIAIIDRETIYGRRDYTDILERLATVSRGSFSAAGVAETWTRVDEHWVV